MQDRLWLRGKHKDIKERLADKLLDGIITYEEKELIAMYLVCESVTEQALKIICCKYWRNEKITTLEKELLAMIFHKNGKGRPKGTDDFNKSLFLWFKATRLDCNTDIQARDNMRKELKEAGIFEYIDDGTLRKKINAGGKALSQPIIEPIADPMQNSYDEGIIKTALLEIK